MSTNANLKVYLFEELTNCNFKESLWVNIQGSDDRNLCLTYIRYMSRKKNDKSCCPALCSTKVALRGLYQQKISFTWKKDIHTGMNAKRRIAESIAIPS